MTRLNFKLFPPDILSLYKLVDRLGNDKPLQRILMLAGELGCKTIVYQKPVTHGGYSSEWEDYYKYIRPCPQNAVEKLNFFSKVLHNASDLKSTQNSDFLGYVCLRPTPSQRVCEAVLRIPHDSDSNYVLAKGKFVSKVGKYSFEVEGTPFVQQDSNAGVCAHASLVTISQIMPNIFPQNGYHPWTVGEIKDCVSKISPPAMGPGLQLAHVSRVFSDMGFSGDTVYIFPEDRTRIFQPEQIIYMYVESKIPVFVGLPLDARGTGHSIVVCGHAFDKQAWWAEAWPAYYNTVVPSGESWLSSVSWINEWIICDDNFGPYYNMSKHLCEVSWVAVPLPKSILVKGETAALNVFWMISSSLSRSLMDEASRRSCSPWIDYFLKYLDDGKLVLRIFLTTPDEFRKSVRSDTKMNADLAQYYLSCDLPDNFWLGELSIPELFGKKLRLGEIIVNASYPPNFIRTGYEALVLTHVPGAIITYDNRNHRPTPYLVTADTPSMIMSR